LFTLIPDTPWGGVGTGGIGSSSVWDAETITEHVPLGEVTPIYVDDADIIARCNVIDQSSVNKE